MAARGIELKTDIEVILISLTHPPVCVRVDAHTTRMHTTQHTYT